MKNSFLPSAVLCSFLVAGAASGATLAQFTGGTNTASFATGATTTAAGLTVGNLTAGSGITFGVSGANFPGAATAPALIPNLVTNTTAASSAAAVTANQFFTFVVTPQAGQSMSLTSMSWVGNSNNGAAPHNITLEVNTGSGFTTVGTYTNVTENNTTTPPSADNVSISLAGFTDITTATTFRFVIWDNAAHATGGSGMRFDDITLDGTVAPVPEPAVAALLFATASVSGLRRRR